MTIEINLVLMATILTHYNSCAILDVSNIHTL